MTFSNTLWRGAWRQLRGEPGPAVLVILGLAVGLALSLLAAAFVRDTLWAEAGLPEAERLITFEWRVRGPGGSTSEWFSDVPASKLLGGLREAGAPVGPMSRVLYLPLPARADAGTGAPRRARIQTLLADPDIATLFALRPVAGDLAAAMASPEGIALTEAGAEKLFGTRQALGRQLTIVVTYYAETPVRSVDVTLTVMAVLPTPSFNSALGSYEALTGLNAPAAKAFVESESSWNFSAGRLFARLNSGVAPGALSTLAQHLLMQQAAPPTLPADFLKGGGDWAYLRAIPMADVGLHGAGSPQRRLQIGSLVAAAAGVLALAVINFINLWSVRTLKRQREIGLRKSLGADLPALLAQFFVETLCVAVLAVAVGLLLAWWGMPMFAVLLQHQFDTPVFAPGLVLMAVGGGVVIALVSALPLAGIALRVQPAESLAGRSHSEGAAGRWLRRALTVLQFGAAALFSALAVVVLWQSEHAGRVQRGMELQDRLAFDLPWEIKEAQTQTLLSRIRTWPEVITVAASTDVPGRAFARGFSQVQDTKGAPVNLQVNLSFSPGLLQVYGVPLLAGRLSPDHAAEQFAVVLERSAVRALGFASPEAAIGQTLAGSADLGDGHLLSVAAVIEDVRLEDTRSPHVPTLLRPVVLPRGGAVSLHSRDPAASRAKLATLLQEVLPEEPPRVLTARQQLARSVETDARLGQLVGVVSLLALLLAAVGIYALAAYTLRRREREIVLRKLHGAGHAAVARLLAREFGAVVGAACLVALPVAAWLGERYLSEFVERAPMGPFGLAPLVIAVLALVGVTALAVLRHLLAAFALRPAQALT